MLPNISHILISCLRLFILQYCIQNLLIICLLQGLKELSTRGNIGVKRMGELDTRPFLEAMKKKYNEDEAEERASELCSLWEEYLKDPDWHPFKVITVEGKEKVRLC